LTQREYRGLARITDCRQRGRGPDPRAYAYASVGVSQQALFGGPFTSDSVILTDSTQSTGPFAQTQPFSYTVVTDGSSTVTETPI